MSLDGYAKLFGSILTSTIWGEDSDTRIVWITLLALADQNGFVATTVPGLSRQASVSVDKCEAAITLFMGPDKYSRTQDNEGRRIVRANGGFLVLNYRKYRDMLAKQERREYQADWSKQKRRQLSTDVDGELPPLSPPTPPPLTPADAEAEAEASASTSRRKRGRPKTSGDCPFPAGWKPTEAHRARCTRDGFDCDHEADRFEAYHRSRGSRFCCWNSAFTTWLLNAKRYRDEDAARKAATGSTDSEKDAAHKEGLRIQREREEVSRRKTQAALDARRREREQLDAPAVKGDAQSLIGEVASKLGGADKGDNFRW
jgi:hypothetical protein